MRTIAMTCAVALGLMLPGCSMTQVEHHESTLPFGSSARLAKRQQILNPEAASDAPVVGLDGRYAATIAEKHYAGPKTNPDDGQSVSEAIIKVTE